MQSSFGWDSTFWKWLHQEQGSTCVQKKKSYPPQEQKEEIPSVFPLHVFCQHQMEFCASAWIYPHARMHEHIQAFKITVAPCSALITISQYLLSCSTLMRKMEQKGRRTRMKERIVIPAKDSLLLLYSLFFSPTGVSVASLMRSVKPSDPSLLEEAYKCFFPRLP